jgi:hypothetical protein
MKFLLAACIIVLLFVPVAFAATRSYQIIEIRSPGIMQPNVSLARVPEGFTGLRGIAGVSVEEPERAYGPQKPFGKPAPKRLKGLAKLPVGYRGLTGIAGAGPNISIAPCARFGCKPGQYVVGDLTTKAVYRCYCPILTNISSANLKCFDTPTVAERAGFHRTEC